MRISDYIPTGKKNATTIKRLNAQTGKSARIIAELIREERISGKRILSSSTGEYWQLDVTEPDAKEQLKRFIAYMESKNTHPTVKSAKEALKELESSAQTHIDGV